MYVWVTHGLIDLLYDRCPTADLSFYLFNFLFLIGAMPEYNYYPLNGSSPSHCGFLLNRFMAWLYVPV